MPITIAFWVKATRAGMFSGCIRNGYTVTRSYVFTYTINSASTWEFKTVTIPGDTVGAWGKGTAPGIDLSFAVMAGASFLTAPGAWVGGAFLGAPGTTNCVATTSDGMFITGVVVLPGIEAPSAARAPFIMRPYDQELLLCQRYFYNGEPPAKGYVTGTAPSTALSKLSVRHPVMMRTTPTLAMTAALSVWDGVAAASLSTITSNYSTTKVLEFDATAAAGMNGRPVGVYAAGTGNLNVDARL